MPQLTCKGLQEKEVQSLSTTLAPKLSELMNTPEDWFTFEYLPVVSFVSGEKMTGEPSVDVRWFDRGQEVQDKIAKIITDSLMNLGYKEVSVVFQALKKECFYDNGNHY